MPRCKEPPRKVTIGTLMSAMWVDYPGVDARLEELSRFIDQMAQETERAFPGHGLDLVVLPEVAITGAGGGGNGQSCLPLEGPVLEGMGDKAREHQTYLVVPMYLTEDGEAGPSSNAAVLLGRDGETIDIYRKVHAVSDRNSGAMEAGVAPGRDFPIFQCDFGRVGAQICFDINFADGWESLAQQGAEIVVWPTQSPQTVQPATRALQHGYYIVSSTWRNNATIFEPTGMIAAQILEPANILVHQVDLSYELLPWQSSLRNGEAMAERYGDRVGYHYSEAEDGGIFWSNDPDLPIGQMVEDMGLETADELLARSLRQQDAARGGPPGE